MFPISNINNPVNMKKMNLIFAGLALTGSLLASCDKEVTAYKQGDILVCIEQGREWLHDFPVFLGIKKKNPPQIAVWVEDMQGKYLSTVYVSHKAAAQDWQMAKGNRRKEALPHWCHCRGIKYKDGLYLPTRDKPLADGISGATPRGSFGIKLNPAKALKQFVVKIEINHSADFNGYYPSSAKEDDAHYSGGKEGSGQPAVIYKAEVDLSEGQTVFEAGLIGHSSPDGSTGEIYPDISGLTTALHIVKRITLHVHL